LISGKVRAVTQALHSPAAAATRPATAERAHERGALAREQLIAHATQIFAAKGYAAATTREICEAAGVNIAAIHYYFGDKEGLYRAVLLQPIREMTAAFGRFDDPALPAEQALRMFLAPFVMPGASENDVAVMRLHLREMIEPSEVFREITAQTIVPAHNALATLLARHCGLAEADADIHQLAFALVAMAHDYCMSREFMKLLAPEVLDRPQAMERILDRLVGYARALLDYEIARRHPAPPLERCAR
jgi:AcrR family transcriptional regulator